MMSKVKSLLVVWKNKKNNQYYHVGTLSYNSKEYIFEYTYHSNAPRKVYEALDDGYFLHPAFPELKKKYISKKLFSAFDRRVPSDSRINYYELLDEMGLPSNADRMDLLKETRGFLPGDPYTFELPLRIEGQILQTNFYVNGMRHEKNLPENWPDNVYLGQKLELILDKENDVDPNAVKIYSSETPLGYVPAIYAQAVSSLLKRGIQVSLTVKNISPNWAPQWWLRVELSAQIEELSKEELKRTLDDLQVVA